MTAQEYPKVICCKEKRFFHLAKEIAGKEPPIPLRRALSLVRILPDRCQWIIHDLSVFGETCPPEKCDQRVNSCKIYQELLPLYDLELIKKECHKLLFFKSNSTNKEEVEHLLQNKGLRVQR